MNYSIKFRNKQFHNNRKSLYKCNCHECNDYKYNNYKCNEDKCDYKCNYLEEQINILSVNLFKLKKKVSEEIIILNDISNIIDS